MTDPIRKDVSTSYGTLVAVGVAAAAIGGALTFGVLALMGSFEIAEDEERPPIIVRGGSLIFESKAPWFEDAKDEWKQYQPGGEPTRVFDLTFEATGCNARTMPEFTVVYDPDDTGTEGERKFTVTRLPRVPGNKGTDGPAVKGSGLTKDNAGAMPKLTYPGTSNVILRVENAGGQSICDKPGTVTATPKR